MLKTAPKEKEKKLSTSGTSNDMEVLTNDQEAIKKYDFTEKSKTYYQPPLPSYLPPPPPLHHHTEPELPGYKPVYEVDFTLIFLSLLPLFLVLGTLFGLALTHIHTESNDTVYLANFSAPSVTVNVNSSSASSSTSSATIVSNRTENVILGYIYPNGTLENITIAIPVLGGFSGILGNLGGILIG